MLAGLGTTFLVGIIVFWSIARINETAPRIYSEDGITHQLHAPLVLIALAPLLLLALFFSITSDFQLLAPQAPFAIVAPILAAGFGGCFAGVLQRSYGASLFARIFAGIVVLFFSAIGLTAYSILIDQAPTASDAVFFLLSYGAACVLTYVILFCPQQKPTPLHKAVCISAIHVILAYAVFLVLSPHAAMVDFRRSGTIALLLLAGIFSIPGLTVRRAKKAKPAQKATPIASVDEFPGYHAVIAANDGTLDFISSELRTVLGLSDKTGVRASIFELFTAENWNEHEFQAAFQSGRYHEIEGRTFRANARKGPIEQVSLRIRGGMDVTLSNKRACITVEFNRDDQKTAEQYKELQTRFALCMDAIPDMFFFVDKNGAVLDLNKSAMEFAHRPKRDCLGERFWNLYSLTEYSPSPQTWLSTLHTACQGGAINVQTEFVSEKIARTFAFSIRNLRNEKIDEPLLLCAGHDITEELKIRDSFARAQSRLEKDIAARTKELREAKLAADTASDTKSRFLANMSHELRTPLNAIIGYTELMLLDFEDCNDEEIDTQNQEDLNRIKLNATHLLALINDILDIAKVEANKMDIVRSEVIANSFFNELEAVIEPLISKNGNTLEIKNNTSADLLFIDKQKVKQCLLNLLSNAAKFTRGGKIFLEATTMSQADNEYLKVTVTDTGSGMTPEQCDAIFDEFVQVSEGENQIASGTGLGLPIAKKFARAMGGNLTAESTPGRGSVFTLTVRLDEGIIEQEADTAA